MGAGMNWTAIGVVGGFILQTLVVVAWVSSKLSTLETMIEQLSKSIDGLAAVARASKDEFWSRNEAKMQIEHRDKEIERLLTNLDRLMKEFTECRTRHGIKNEAM